MAPASAWAFQRAGYPLLRTDKHWRVTPRDLLLSPALREYGMGQIWGKLTA